MNNNLSNNRFSKLLTSIRYRYSNRIKFKQIYVGTVSGKSRNREKHFTRNLIYPNLYLNREIKLTAKISGLQY